MSELIDPPCEFIQRQVIECLGHTASNPQRVGLGLGSCRVSGGHYLVLILYVADRLWAVSDTVQLIFDFVDRDDVGVIAQLDVIAAEIRVVFQYTINAIQSGRDRARTGSSGHPQIHQVDMLLA